MSFFLYFPIFFQNFQSFLAPLNIINTVIFRNVSDNSTIWSLCVCSIFFVWFPFMLYGLFFVCGYLLILYWTFCLKNCRNYEKISSRIFFSSSSRNFGTLLLLDHLNTISGTGISVPPRLFEAECQFMCGLIW
jgi:hypothetical protein